MTRSNNYKGRLRPLQNAHPGLDLARVYVRFQSLNEASNGAKKFSRRELMKDLGFGAETSGAANTLISALVHFGLLNKSGTDYIYSPIASRLLATTPDSEQFFALLREVALTPELYKWIYDEYGNDIPENISEKLIRKYRHRNINTPKAAERVVSNYRKTLEFASMDTQDKEVKFSSPSEEYIEVAFRGQTVAVYKRYLIEAIQKTHDAEIEKINATLM